MNSLELRKIRFLAVMITALNPCAKNIVYAMEATAETEQQRQNRLNQSLLATVQSKNIEKIKELVSQGANPNFKPYPQTGWSLMHNAVQHGNIEVIKVLASLGADVNIKDNYGETPLHYAASTIQNIATGNVEVIKTLVELGADVNVKDNSNRTPLDIAETSAHKYGTVNSSYLKNMISLKQRALEHIRERIRNRTITRAELDQLPEDLKEHIDIPNDLP
jgi:hypothetical protein